MQERDRPDPSCRLPAGVFRALGGGKIKATHKSFRARAIAVLEVNDRAEITACTEYYDRTTMPIGEPTPFNDLTWPQNALGRLTNSVLPPREEGPER
jgi:hypothetical protein